MHTKTEVFRKYLSAYLKADKSGKGKMLDTVCDVTGMHRKAAIRRDTLPADDRACRCFNRYQIAIAKRTRPSQSIASQEKN